MDVNTESAHELLTLSDSARRPLYLLIALLVAIVFRPWDFVPALAAVKPVTLMIVALLGLTWMDGNKIEYFRLPLSRTFFALWMLMLVTIPISYWPSLSLDHGIKYGQSLILFGMMGALVVSYQSLKLMTSFLVIVGAVLSVIAIYFDATSSEKVDGRIAGFGTGMLSDPNELANTLAMIAPLAWWMITCSTSARSKVVGFGSLGLMIVAILITQSRGGLLSMVGVLGVLLFASRAAISKKAVVVGVLCAAAILAMPGKFAARYATISSAAEKDESAQIRLAVWQAGAEMFVDHFVTGVGLGSFEMVYGTHYINREVCGNGWRAAHNSVVEAACELGVVGGLLWMTFAFTPLWLLWKVRIRLLDYEDEDETADLLRQWIECMAAGLVAFLIGAMFLSKAFDLLIVITVAMSVIGYQLSMNWIDLLDESEISQEPEAT